MRPEVCGGVGGALVEYFGESGGAARPATSGEASGARLVVGGEPSADARVAGFGDLGGCARQLDSAPGGRRPQGVGQPAWGAPLAVTAHKDLRAGDAVEARGCSAPELRRGSVRTTVAGTAGASAGAAEAAAAGGAPACGRAGPRRGCEGLLTTCTTAGAGACVEACEAESTGVETVRIRTCGETCGENVRCGVARPCSDPPRLCTLFMRGPDGVLAPAWHGADGGGCTIADDPGVGTTHGATTRTVVVCRHGGGDCGTVVVCRHGGGDTLVVCRHGSGDCGLRSAL